MATKDNIFTLSSSALQHNKKIPAKYTCDGANISPALQWQHAPEGTKSFALIVDDPDAPGKTWVHWVVWNIPVSMTALPEGIQSDAFMQGATDFNGAQQYGGPCPPSGVHHYRFTLYALDTILSLPRGSTKEDLIAAMQGDILGTAQLIALYERNKLS
ncbi:YbhB/YbcL family Raf kinase inhibitor-like protein [Candidatus Dependentiae bacterium]|nr:YbhB/YbcL family Raf kinase inhibitor-like protein [Candidatus Dependentiae bacterium]